MDCLKISKFEQEDYPLRKVSLKDERKELVEANNRGVGTVFTNENNKRIKEIDEQIKIEKIANKLSKDVEWSGYDILEVCKLALTDANFHKEARILHGLQLDIDNDPMNDYEDNS